jgi:hypothetical protein
MKITENNQPMRNCNSKDELQKEQQRKKKKIREKTKVIKDRNGKEGERTE